MLNPTKLVEYLTDKQRKSFAHIEMSDKAKADTDHFFGKGNNKVVEPIKHITHEKSEIHKQVESHLGKQISPEEYSAGLHTDKHGRQAKIGKSISDEKLRNHFASDPARSGKSEFHGYTMSIHRGTEVAGQANPEPNATHPSGHSWHKQSCKNIKDGQFNDALHDEIHHGSVVAFAHDHDGKEIYRATLHPHHNVEDKVAYAVNSEYGVKHPTFTHHAHDIAKRLSHKLSKFDDHSASYYIHPDVYNDSKRAIIKHPESKSISEERQPLTVQQRLTKGKNLKRIQPKLVRMRELKAKRMADPARLQYRARKMAISYLRKKFAGSRGVKYARLNPAEKISVDKQIQSKMNTVGTIASRMLPKVRVAEIKRLARARTRVAKYQ